MDVINVICQTGAVDHDVTQINNCIIRTTPQYLVLWNVAGALCKPNLERE